MRHLHTGRPRPGHAVAVTAVLGCLVVVAACSAGGSDARPSSRIDPVSIGAGDHLLTRRQIPRLEYTIVQGDDRRLLITGGRIEGRHGINPAFVYDIPTHTLTRVDDAPFSPAADGVVGLAIGHAVVVAGTACRDVGDRHDDPPIRVCEPGTPVAARFDLRTQAWTRLPAPPAGLIPLGTHGTTGYYRSAPPSGGGVHSYDDTTRRWLDLPAPPTPDLGTTCVTGAGRIVTLDAHPRPGTPPEGIPADLLIDSVALYRLDPGAAEWAPVPPPPLRFYDELTDHHANVFQLVCGDRGVLLTEYDLARTWFHDDATDGVDDTRPPVTTSFPAPDYLQRMAVGDRFFFWGRSPTGAASGLVFDATRGSWATFAPGAIAPYGDQAGRDALVGGTLYALYAARAGDLLRLASWTSPPPAATAG